MRPHLSVEEYKNTEYVVQQFGQKEGVELHKMLLERAKTTKNWVRKVSKKIINPPQIIGNLT